MKSPRGAGPGVHHLRRLTDARGVFEHATAVTPRRTTATASTMSRGALVVTCREPEVSRLDDLREQYLVFVLAAQQSDGRFHNRSLTRR